MALLDLLYIYDATIDFADQRRDASFTIAHTGGLIDLVKRLRELVNNGVSFRRCVVTTHGFPGKIVLGSGGRNGDVVDAWGLNKRCVGQELHRLFPLPNSRLYFNGCQVGAEPGGKEFVTTAAQIFLRLWGGTAFAMTSNGYSFPIWFIHNGHVVHFSGGIVSTTVGPCGVVIPDPPIVWPEPPNHRDNVGNKI